MTPTDEQDLASPDNPDNPDGGGGGDDGGGTGDGGKSDGGKMDGGMTGTGLPCTPGSYRCGGGSSVEICNSSGSAWLYAQTCAVSCNAGLCTGACTPTERRCNANKVEECNGAGTAWSVKETCTTFCASAQCALNGLEVTMNRNLDGEVIVDGDVIVRSGATLSSPQGDLTIRARSITVENGATIAAAPTGDTPAGKGRTDSYYRSGGGGGSYGSAGGYDSGGSGSPGATYGSDSDANVQAGSKGGDNAYPGNGGTGGAGGGVLRLLAETSITVAGFVTANGVAGTNAPSSSYGGGGGGSGGGILLGAGGDLTVSGTVSAAGGAGGGGTGYQGGKGGNGRVKLLAGGKRMVTGMVTGQRTDGILPPMLITSSSHPDPTLIYNDDFPSVDITWSRPFPSRQGYYQLMNTSQYQVPTPAAGTFVNTEMTTLMPTAVRSGSNYFHLATVDSMSNVGTVESSLRIQINTSAPSVSSMSHPSQSAWSANNNPFFQWSFPNADRNYKGVYYVLDRYGSTVPEKTTATFIPVTQKQQLISAVAPGIWVMHVVTVDQRDYLTKAAGHYRVNVGDDPGTGVVLGQVVDMANKPIDGATVTINRGLWTQTTNSTGNFNLPSVAAGTFELRVSKAGYMAATKMVDVTKGGSTTANITLN